MSSAGGVGVAHLHPVTRPPDDAVMAAAAHAVRVHVPVLVLSRAPHEQQARQDAEEHPAHPRRHRVRRRPAEVDVEDQHGRDDGESHEYHGEEEVLPDERDDEGGGRDDLGEQEEEDGEREQNVDAERDLLAAVGRQVEDEHRQEGDGDRRDDQVDGVEEGLAADHDAERDVRVRLRAAGVVAALRAGGHPHQVPLAAVVEVLQVDAALDVRVLVRRLVLADVNQVDLRPRRGPMLS